MYFFTLYWIIASGYSNNSNTVVANSPGTASKDSRMIRELINSEP